jgi:hypothetical protein
MISAVARIYTPGSKADCALVLEGPQGIGKSTVLRNISFPWFTDEVAAFGTKDASKQTIGIWIVELSELDAVTRAADVAHVKASCRGSAIGLQHLTVAGCKNTRGSVCSRPRRTRRHGTATTPAAGDGGH